MAKGDGATTGRRGRVWRAASVAAVVAAALTAGAGSVHADEPVAESAPPPVPTTVPEADTEPVVVAVGLPPVPPATTAAPTTVVVAVAPPPVPPARTGDGTPEQAAPAPDESSVAGAVASALAASALAVWQQS